MRDQQPEQDPENELYTQRLRLNKFLAERGICSRRDADLWIESGRVTVNDEYVDVGAYVDDNDQVRVDGELIAAYKLPKRVYIALNKPVDIECTTDTRVDGNIVDFVGHHERVFPIGRLDKDSDGLILLTNDGDIVNKILRSEQNHEKEYLVTVDHKVSAEFLRGMASGVRILRRTTKPCRTYKVAANTFGIVLTEGMNRQIRKMAEAFNYRVLKLTRVRIMNVTLGHLKLGRWRNLTPVELAGLRTSIQNPAPALVLERRPRAATAKRSAAPAAKRSAAPAKRSSSTSIGAGPSATTAAKRPARAVKPAAIWDQARTQRATASRPVADGEARRASSPAGLARKPSKRSDATARPARADKPAGAWDTTATKRPTRRPSERAGSTSGRVFADGEARRASAPAGSARKPNKRADTTTGRTPTRSAAKRPAAKSVAAKGPARGVRKSPGAGKSAARSSSGPKR